jgi:hypothetical protein
MPWIVTVVGSKEDVSRLLEAVPSEVGPGSDERSARLLVVVPDDAGNADRDAKPRIDALVARLNGLGKLRWGRAFDGVEIRETRRVDEDGREAIVAFVGAATAYVTHEQMVKIARQLGHTPPEDPPGLGEINALSLPDVFGLAATEPAVATALRLVELAHEGEDYLDWRFAYCAWELVKDHAQRAALNPIALGWWTDGERRRFTATANSPEALGVRARHARPQGLPRRRMTEKEASWFVRRVVTRWMNHLLATA